MNTLLLPVAGSRDSHRPQYFTSASAWNTPGAPISRGLEYQVSSGALGEAHGKRGSTVEKLSMSGGSEQERGAHVKQCFPNSSTLRIPWRTLRPQSRVSDSVGLG